MQRASRQKGSPADGSSNCPAHGGEWDRQGKEATQRSDENAVRAGVSAGSDRAGAPRRRGGVSLARIARDLEVSQDTLRAWVRQADVDGGRRDGLTTDERAELTQLRRENRLLKMERELLKKATVFFAKEGEVIR